MIVLLRENANVEQLASLAQWVKISFALHLDRMDSCKVTIYQAEKLQLYAGHIH